MKTISIFFALLLSFLVLAPLSAQADECKGGTGTTCSSLTTSAACNTKASSGCSWYVTGDANKNAFVDVMCNALKIVTGNAGKAFAAFAIISVGIGFFSGKVSWGLMIGVTAGIAAMFGAPTIVAAIAGGDALECSGSII